MKKVFLVWDTWNMEEEEAKPVEANDDPEELAEKFAEHRFYSDEAFKEIRVSVKEKGGSEIKTFDVRVEWEPYFKASEVKGDPKKWK